MTGRRIPYRVTMGTAAVSSSRGVHAQPRQHPVRRTRGAAPHRPLRQQLAHSLDHTGRNGHLMPDRAAQCFDQRLWP
ncbi:hypothetical protein M2275_008081 [Rhodococcus opacus]|nr:hypothetical protein [Rhodococcus opacus]